LLTSFIQEQQPVTPLSTFPAAVLADYFLAKTLRPGLVKWPPDKTPIKTSD